MTSMQRSMSFMPASMTSDSLRYSMSMRVSVLMASPFRGGFCIQQTF